MKKALALGLMSVFALGAFAGCSFGREEDTPTPSVDNPLAENRIKLMQFDYGDVTLGEGIFKEVYDGAKEYYLGLSVDDMFYGIRNYLHLDTKTGKDLEGNYQTGDTVLGQWISGNARYYAAEKTPELKTRMTEIADAVDEVTKKKPLFTGGISLYTFEKHLQGCLDLYTLCGEQKGFDSAKRMMDAALEDKDYTGAKKLLGDNGTQDNMRELEWYTTSESVYAFAEVAKKNGCTATEVRKYTDFAKSFEYTEFWDIFANKKDMFDYSPQAGMNTKYFHAYSHLNSFNSAAAAYATTGKQYYLDSMTEFYKFMRDTQELATGGYGAHTEWLMPEEGIVDGLTYHHDNYENQCDTYAVYRLGNRLASFTGDARYGNWSEKLLYNSSIASLETKDGKAFYYSDYCANGGSKELRQDWLWPCCSGSRPLNLNEVLRTVYYHDTQNLYVNLFVNSSVSLDTENGTIALSQQSDFPESDKITFTVQKAPSFETAIKFRKPEWLAGKASVTVNGEAVEATEEKAGWLSVRRVWSANDKIELTLPAKLTVSKFSYDDEFGTTGVFAVNYGPVTLAANTENPILKIETVLNAKQDIASQLNATDKPLVYTAKADDSLQLKPFYSYEAGERYYLYIKFSEVA